MKTVHYVSLFLAIVGAVNWGLWGLFQFDLVAALCGGQAAPLSRVVYSIVGLAGLALAFTTAIPHSGLPMTNAVPAASRT